MGAAFKQPLACGVEALEKPNWPLALGHLGKRIGKTLAVRIDHKRDGSARAILWITAQQSSNLLDLLAAGGLRSFDAIASRPGFRSGRSGP
jgi:hypothetical protein